MAARNLLIKGGATAASAFSLSAFVASVSAIGFTLASSIRVPLARAFSERASALKYDAQTDVLDFSALKAICMRGM